MINYACLTVCGSYIMSEQIELHMRLLHVKHIYSAI